MKLIHVSDMYLGFNDLDVINCLCDLNSLIYAIHATYHKTILLAYYLLSCKAIVKIFVEVVGFLASDEVFGSQGKNRRMEILKRFIP